MRNSSYNKFRELSSFHENAIERWIGKKKYKIIFYTYTVYVSMLTQFIHFTQTLIFVTCSLLTITIFLLLYCCFFFCGRIVLCSLYDIEFTIVPFTIHKYTLILNRREEIYEVEWMNMRDEAITKQWEGEREREL